MWIFYQIKNLKNIWILNEMWILDNCEFWLYQATKRVSYFHSPPILICFWCHLQYFLSLLNIKWFPFSDKNLGQYRIMLSPFLVSLKHNSPPSLTNHSGTLTQGDFCGLTKSGGNSKTASWSWPSSFSWYNLSK